LKTTATACGGFIITCNHISLQGFEIYQVSNLMYNIECCDGIQTFIF
jgi:hypothetical protein